MELISINDDGSLWAVEKSIKNKVWYNPAPTARPAGKWTHLGEKTANITSNADHVCAVTFGKRLMCKKKNDKGEFEREWTVVWPGVREFIDASVNGDGSVWGLTNKGLFFCPDWETCAGTPSNWKKVENAPTRMVQVSSKANLVCIRFKETGNDKTAKKVKCQRGNSEEWKPIPGYYSHVSVQVSENSKVLTLGVEGKVRYCENLDAKTAEKACSLVGHTTFTQIEISKNGKHVCGINTAGTILCRLKPLQVV